jgi:hypothetical protein
MVMVGVGGGWWAVNGAESINAGMGVCLGWSGVGGRKGREMDLIAGQARRQVALAASRKPAKVLLIVPSSFLPSRSSSAR